MSAAVQTIEGPVMFRQAEREGLGVRLKEARERARCTQADAALAAGVNRSAVSNWERGRHTPNLLQFKSLIALYGISGHYVLFGHNLFEMTPAECMELGQRSKSFSDELQRKVEMLLTVLATVGADKAERRKAGHSETSSG